MLTIKTGLNIQKPSQTVFEAIIDPAQMKNYFISKGSARLKAGATVDWEFPEMPGMSFPVEVDEVIPNEKISFRWKDEHGTETSVNFLLSANGPSTRVDITEGSRRADEAGIKWYAQNTAGWMNFLDCLKAWLEYGINLRKGSFSTQDMPDL